VKDCRNRKKERKNIMQAGRPLTYADFVLLAVLCLSPAHTQKKNKIT
jgi:hypothetical protein